MKQKSMFLSYVTVIVVFVLVTSATYAYFATGSFNVTNVTNLNSEVINAKAAFTAYSNDAIELSVGLANLIVAQTNATVFDSGDYIVKLTSPVAGEEMQCTYDIDFVWDTTAQYTTPSMAFTATYPYELSVAATVVATGDSYSGYNYASKNVVERDLSTLSWTGNAGTVGRKATVVSQAMIYTNTVAGTTATWTFNVKFYTLPVSQSTLLGKSLKAHLTAANIDC